MPDSFYWAQLGSWAAQVGKEHLEYLKWGRVGWHRGIRRARGRVSGHQTPDSDSVKQNPDKATGRRVRSICQFPDLCSSSSRRHHVQGS
jgi:hypothetical protein